MNQALSIIDRERVQKTMQNNEHPAPLADNISSGLHETLRLSEELADVGHWQFDFESGAVAWSDGMYNIYGVDREGLVPTFEAVLQAYHPDDRSVLQECVLGARRGQSFTYKLRLRRLSDGEEVIVSANATVQMDEAGNPKTLFGVLKDVTEHERVVAQLKERELAFRLLAENATDVISRYGNDGVFRYLSPAIHTVLGYYPAELVGRKTFDIIHPDDHVSVERQFSSCVNPGISAPTVRVEYRARHKDGHYVWLEAHPKPIFDDRGQVIEFHDVTRDVTQRKSAEAAITASEARYRLLTENANDIVTELDQGGRFTYVSPAIFKLTGYTPEEAIGRVASDFVHPDDREMATLAFATILNSPAGATVEYRVIRKDGQVIWVEAQPTFVKDPLTGKPIGATDVVRDVTARKITEAALAESEKRYRLLAENASDMIAQFNSLGEIIYISPGCHSILGYRPEEMLGRNALDYMHPDDFSGVQSYYETLISEGPDGISVPYQFRAQHIDGRWLWLEGQPKIFFDSKTEQFSGMQDVVRDISKRKELELELQRAKSEAEAASVVKSEFLSNMSHELRTPLTSILGFSSLLRGHVDQEGQGATFLSRVTGACEALMSIVNDILDFSKLEAGQVEIDRHVVSPSSVVENAVQLLAPQAAAKGLFLTFEATNAVPSSACLDDVSIRQVVLNLTSNAVKFTASGGVCVRLDYATNRLRCEIIDTGSGIPTDRLDRLFQRFSQVDASTTRSHGGTGLGLAICKGLVEAMGGQVGVNSSEGKGSTFWFELPCGTEAAVSTSDNALKSEFDPVGILAGLRMLVADDNPSNQELIRVMLEAVDIEATIVSSGMAALEAAATAPFDIILIDVHMPGLDGPECARQIRQTPGPNDLAPLLAFTAAAEAGAHSWSSMFDDVISKPIMAPLLFETIRRWAPGTEGSSLQATATDAKAGGRTTAG